MVTPVMLNNCGIVWTTLITLIRTFKIFRSLADKKLFRVSSLDKLSMFQTFAGTSDRNVFMCHHNCVAFVLVTVKNCLVFLVQRWRECPHPRAASWVAPWWPSTGASSTKPIAQHVFSLEVITTARLETRTKLPLASFEHYDRVTDIVSHTVQSVRHE